VHEYLKPIRGQTGLQFRRYSSHKFRFSQLGYRPDGCIVWNAHNTVFGSRRSAICALAVYFVHLSRPKIQGVVSRDSIVDPQAPIPCMGHTTKIWLWGLSLHGMVLYEHFTEINIMSAKSTAGAAL